MRLSAFPQLDTCANRMNVEFSEIYVRPCAKKRLYLIPSGLMRKRLKLPGRTADG